DIKKYIYLILGHWWLFAITIFISCTIAYLINRYSQEVYEVKCSIIIGEPESKTGSIESLLNEFTKKRNKQRKAVVENEMSILKSYKMAQMALEELNFDITYTSIGRRNIAECRLYTRCPFIVLPDTSKPISATSPIYVTILSNDEYLLTINDDLKYTKSFGETVDLGSNTFSIVLRNPGIFDISSQQSNKYHFIINDFNSLVKSYMNGLSVEVNSEKGSVLTLSLSGYVPEKISDYLNKLSEIYIRSNLKDKNITSENTINFIDEQINGIIDSLEITGLRLQKFRSTNKVINLSEEGSFLFKKMQDLQTERAALEIKDKYYGYLLEYVNMKNDFSDVVAPSVVGIQDQLLSELVSNLNKLNLERRNLNLSVFENSPQTLRLNNQIKNTRSALQENLYSRIEGNK
ncbi:MAG: hypothetical protein MI922_24160, partial [Bacteroidales bacterium]|nr:hypothetical protein [Bacteroidales bacterium]